MDSYDFSEIMVQSRTTLTFEPQFIRRIENKLLSDWQKHGTIGARMRQPAECRISSWKQQAALNRSGPV